MLQTSEATTIKARRLRQSMTLPEVLLWVQLRKKHLGYRFRRQHPAGPYIADFFCVEAMLIVEVDGSNHDFPDQIERDAVRDAFFARHNIKTLRILARDILLSMRDAIETILYHCAQCAPLRQPCGLTPPLKGEDLIRSNT